MPIEISLGGSYGFGTKMDRFSLKPSKLKMEDQSQILTEEKYADGVVVENPRIMLNQQNQEYSALIFSD